MYVSVLARAGADVLLFAYLPLYLHEQVGEQRMWLIGLVIATPALVRFITGPLWGRWADRSGRQRPFIVVGLAAYSLTLFLLPHLATTEAIIILIAFLSVLFSAFKPVGRTWLALSSQKQGAVRLTRWYQWESLGYLLAAVTIGWLSADGIGLMGTVMRFLGVFLALCALATLFRVNNLAVRRPAIRRESEGVKESGRREARWRGMVAGLSLTLIVFLFWSSFGWEAFHAMFGLYFTVGLQGSTRLYGLTIALSLVVTMAVYPSLVKHGQRHGYRALLVLAAWGYTIMYTMMAVPSLWAVALAYLLPMSAVVRTAVNIFVATEIDAGRRGRAMGIVESAEASSTMGGAFIGGMLADHFGLAMVPLAALGSSLLLHGMILWPRRIRR